MKRGRKRRLRARDFGDNPRIRRKYGEYKTINIQEPWERYYWQIKKIKKLGNV